MGEGKPPQTPRSSLRSRYLGAVKKQVGANWHSIERSEDPGGGLPPMETTRSIVSPLLVGRKPKMRLHSPTSPAPPAALAWTGVERPAVPSPAADRPLLAGNVLSIGDSGTRGKGARPRCGFLISRGEQIRGLSSAVGRHSDGSPAWRQLPC